MKNLFSSFRNAQFFVVCEAVLVLLIALLLYKILWLQTGSFAIPSMEDPVQFLNVALLVSSVIFGVLVNYAIVTHDDNVRLIQKQLFGTIFAETKKKATGTNKQVALLWVFEIVIALIIAVSIYVYLDPEINVLPPSVPTWAKIVGFCALVGFALYVFSQTKMFRDIFYGPSLLRSVLWSKERNFHLKRTTNPARKTVRIASADSYRQIRHLHKHFGKRKKI